jgi:AraC-like DNA-binding protein
MKCLNYLTNIRDSLIRGRVQFLLFFNLHLFRLPMLPGLAILGFFLSGMLVTYTSRIYRSALYLGLFFFSLSVYVLLEYANVYSKSTLLVSITFLNFTFLTYLAGPMLFFYIRSLLTDNFRLRKMDLIHFLPMLVYLASTLPYMLTPYSTKIEVASKIVEDSANVGYLNREILVFPFWASLLSRPLFLLAYALLSWGIFISYIRRNRGLPVISGQIFMKKWIPLLLAFTTILSVVHLIQMGELLNVKDVSLLYTLNKLMFLSGVGLAGLLISPVFFPRILYGLPHLPESISDSVSDQNEPDMVKLRVIRPQVMLEKDYLHLIGHKIDACMKELKPYLNADCNLDYISRLIEVPAHHLAYYFRAEKKQTFTDYRNEWRVKHAKELISEGKSGRITLEAIGLLSGFSSRNTFFTVFKKSEGISPGDFASRFSA